MCDIRCTYISILFSLVNVYNEVPKQKMVLFPQNGDTPSLKTKKNEGVPLHKIK